MIHAFYHARTETLGLIGETLKKLHVPVKEHHLYRGDKVPPHSKEITGLIVMGGAMNVDEHHLYPFLKPEIKLIRQAVRAGTPYLGICLGAQLLAKALGSDVYPNKVREVGWHPVEFKPAAKKDRLLSGLPKKLTVLHWHGDTFHLPKNSTLLASSPRCKSQAFRWGKFAYGLQFHFEVTPAMIKQWVKGLESRDYIRGAGEDPKGIVNKTGAAFRKLKPWALTVFERFAKAKRQHQEF